MASRKKQSEAFDLLMSMYDDDDDDMEDAEKSPEQQQQEGNVERVEQVERETQMNSSIEQQQGSNPNDAASTPNWTSLRPPTPAVAAATVEVVTEVAEVVRVRREKATIVDYGHDDVAMSPDDQAEDGEILGTSSGRVMFGEERESTNENAENTPSVNVLAMTPNNLSSSPNSIALVDASLACGTNGATKESEDEVTEDVNIFDEDVKDVDPLDKFLPPPPAEECSDELQEKINKFLAYKRQGKIFNVEVRNRKDYRNPDFLRHAVRYQEIDEIGSNFAKDVFDPHGYDASDYYDSIEVDMKREMERKEQERKKNQKVEFVSGGTQAGIVAAQKVSLPSPSVPGLPSGGSLSSSTDAIIREGRSKRSKWDKVDGDRRNISGGGKDSTSAAGAHAALLSAANAGAGYAIFAQQKRREAEERRSGEKKVERRS